MRDNGGEYHLAKREELDKFQGCEVKYMFQFARGSALKALNQVALGSCMLAMRNLRLQSITQAAEHHTAASSMLLAVIDLLAYNTVLAGFLRRGVSDAAAQSDGRSVSGQRTCLACHRNCDVAKAASLPFFTDCRNAVERGASRSGFCELGVLGKTLQPATPHLHATTPRTLLHGTLGITCTK